MKISFELVISVIALITSILSPIITMYIQKRYELKMKRLDIYETRKLDAIENYSKAVQSCIVSGTMTQEYREYGSLIFLYAPPSVYDDIQKIDLMLHPYNPSENLYDSQETKVLLSKIIRSCFTD